MSFIKCYSTGSHLWIKVSTGNSGGTTGGESSPFGAVRRRSRSFSHVSMDMVNRPVCQLCRFDTGKGNSLGVQKCIICGIEQSVVKLSRDTMKLSRD